MGTIIWGFFLVYESQTRVSEVKLENRDSIISAVTVYLDVFVLVLKVTELLRQIIIKERSWIMFLEKKKKKIWIIFLFENKSIKYIFFFFLFSHNFLHFNEVAKYTF